MGRIWQREFTDGLGQADRSPGTRVRLPSLWEHARTRTVQVRASLSYFTSLTDLAH